MIWQTGAGEARCQPEGLGIESLDNVQYTLVTAIQTSVRRWEHESLLLCRLDQGLSSTTIDNSVVDGEVIRANSAALSILHVALSLRLSQV